MVKKIKATNLPKSEYKNYCAKALEFCSVMNMCLMDNEWDSVILNGVHAAISMNDAVCVFHLGKRCLSRFHQDAAKLLSQALASQETKVNAARLADLINFKNQVEYEPRRFTAKEAKAFAVKVDRFIRWAQKQLPQ